jgi:hypothetical protein
VVAAQNRGFLLGGIVTGPGYCGEFSRIHLKICSAARQKRRNTPQRLSNSYDHWRSCPRAPLKQKCVLLSQAGREFMAGDSQENLLQ